MEGAIFGTRARTECIALFDETVSKIFHTLGVSGDVAFGTQRWALEVKVRIHLEDLVSRLDFLQREQTLLELFAHQEQIEHAFQLLNETNHQAISNIKQEALAANQDVVVSLEKERQLNQDLEERLKESASRISQLELEVALQQEGFCKEKEIVKQLELQQGPCPTRTTSQSSEEISNVTNTDEALAGNWTPQTSKRAHVRESTFAGIVAAFRSNFAGGSVKAQ